MVFEFLSHLDMTSGFLLVIIFILFMLSFKKVLGLLKNAIIIIIASVLFPIVGNKILGLPIPMDGGTIFSFIFLGLLLYFLYILGSAVYKGLSFLERGAKQLPKIEKPERPKEKHEDREEPAERPQAYGKPFVLGPKKARKSWERDFVSVGESTGAKEKPVQQTAKKRKKKSKANMERIRVIGEDE